MAYDPNWPPTNAELESAPFRVQFQGLKALIDAQAAQLTALAALLVPVGGVCAWMKDLPGVPALPANFVECNGQVLNDPASLLDGVTLPNLNGASGGVPRFLRGATTSGGEGGGESHAHPGTTDLGNFVEIFDVPVASSLGASRPDHTHTFTTDAASSLPSYHEVVWVMRVK
jgi:hypothetical protein